MACTCPVAHSPPSQSLFLDQSSQSRTIADSITGAAPSPQSQRRSTLQSLPSSTQGLRLCVHVRRRCAVYPGCSQLVDRHTSCPLSCCSFASPASGCHLLTTSRRHHCPLPPPILHARRRLWPHTRGAHPYCLCPALESLPTALRSSPPNRCRYALRSRVSTPIVFSQRQHPRRSRQHCTLTTAPSSQLSAHTPTSKHPRVPR